MSGSLAVDMANALMSYAANEVSRKERVAKLSPDEILNAMSGDLVEVGARPPNLKSVGLTMSEVRQKIDDLHDKSVAIRAESDLADGTSNVDYDKLFRDVRDERNKWKYILQKMINIEMKLRGII